MDGYKRSLVHLMLCGALVPTLGVADELEPTARALLSAVASGNLERMAEVVCLDQKSHRKLGRMEQLGLIEDADDPATRAAYQARYLDALRQRLAGLAATDPADLAFDHQRISTAGQEGLLAQGVLGIAGDDGLWVDVPVTQSEDGVWCLDPFWVL